MSNELLDYAADAPGREHFSEITVPVDVFHNLATGYASPYDIGHVNNWSELLTYDVYRFVVAQATSRDWDVARHLPGLGDALNGARQSDTQEFRRAWGDPYLNGLVTRFRQKSRELGTDQPPPEQLVTRIITEMGAAAAAAAIRCDLPRFEVHAYVGGQTLTLPSLGALQLPRPAASVAVRRDGVGKVTVTSEAANFESDLPSNLREATPDWRPLTLLTSTYENSHVSLVLDDVAPNRKLFVPNHLDTLPASDRASWHGLIDPMWHTLARHFPGDALSIASLMQTIVPLRAPLRGIATYSNAMATGLTALSLPSSPESFAKELLHEYQHNILAALSRVAGLDGVLRYDDERFWAPWRFDARPLGGLAHGVKAHIHIARFCKVMMNAAPTRSERRAYAIEFARWRAQVGQAFGALSGGVTQPKDYDTRLLAGLQEGVSDLFEVPIEERYGNVAQDELDYNRGIWQLANTRVDPEKIRELADVFLALLLASRSPDSNAQKVLSSVVPESIMSGLLASMQRKAEAYTTLPRVEFVDSNKAASVYQGLDRRELFDLYQNDSIRFDSLCKDPSGLADFPGALAADLHLIRGDYDLALSGYTAHIQQAPEDASAWPGFIVAYDRTRKEAIVPNSAKRVLMHRPELLHALYSHVNRQCVASGRPALIDPKAFLWQLAFRLPMKSPWT